MLVLLSSAKAGAGAPSASAASSALAPDASASAASPADTQNHMLPRHASLTMGRCAIRAHLLDLFHCLELCPVSSLGTPNDIFECSACALSDGMVLGCLHQWALYESIQHTRQPWEMIHGKESMHLCLIAEYTFLNELRVVLLSIPYKLYKREKRQSRK